MYLITDGGEELSIFVCGWRSSHLILVVKLSRRQVRLGSTEQAVGSGIIAKIKW